VDVGASGGFFSVLFAVLRTEASTIVSIEPDPGARQVLIDMRNRNFREMVNWEIEHRAVMSHAQTARFVSSGYGAEVLTQLGLQNARKCASEDNSETTVFEVLCATLPELLSKYCVQLELKRSTSSRMSTSSSNPHLMLSGFRNPELCSSYTSLFFAREEETKNC
jgi:FkbM family methyltransferase